MSGGGRYRVVYLFKNELNIEVSDQRSNFSENLITLSNKELPRSEEVEKVVEEQLAVSKEKDFKNCKIDRLWSTCPVNGRPAP